MTQKIENGVRINLILPEQYLNVAKLLAAMRGTTYSEIIRTSLIEYIRKELPAQKDFTALENETLESLLDLYDARTGDTPEFAEGPSGVRDGVELAGSRGDSAAA